MRKLSGSRDKHRDMTRFAATEKADRHALITAALEAHEQRASAYVTLEADPQGDVPRPWIQYRIDDQVLNLDCTEPELETLIELLSDYSEFTIVSQERPDHATGINVRVQAYADRDRLGAVIERIFREVYDCPTNYRLWAAEV